FHVTGVQTCALPISHSVAHVGMLFVFLAEFHAHDSVRLLDLFLDDLADVVQQPGAACLGGIKAQLGGHERADARRLDGVGEQVLAVAGAVLHAPDEADQLGVQAVQVQVDDGAFAGLDDLFLHLGAGLVHHLFDASGVDASVLDEACERDAGHLAAYRIEAGEDDGFRRIVYDDLDPRGGFEGADVAPFAPDDATLHLVRLDVDHRDRVFDGLAGGGALDGGKDDLARLAV